MVEKKVGYPKEVREGVLRYIRENPEATIKAVSEKFEVSDKTIYAWKKKEEKGQESFRGRGNYASEEAKEMAKLRKENKDLKDALEVLKKAIGLVGK